MTESKPQMDSRDGSPGTSGSDWVMLAVFLGHLVLAGDTGGQRSCDEWGALLRHRAGPAAVSEARTCALLPRYWALFSWSSLHEQ
jgi:hypothetical protein